MFWVGWAVNRLTLARNRIVTVPLAVFTNPTLGATKIIYPFFLANNLNVICHRYKLIGIIHAKVRNPKIMKQYPLDSHFLIARLGSHS